MPVESLVANLIVILGTGFAAGLVCKRLGVSLLIGYLLAGAIVGPNALGFVSQASHELESVAQAGALFLLFAVGLEFSLPELIRYRRHFFTGGDVLRRAHIPTCRLAVICVPVDDVARDVVRAVRELNSQASILVRCRFQSNASKLRRAGADIVVSEESEAANSIIRRCMEMATKR